MTVAFVPGIEGIETLEDHLLRRNAVLASSLGRPVAAIHSKVPGRQVDLIGVGHTIERVLKVWIITNGD